jgi:hypothetical protein
VIFKYELEKAKADRLFRRPFLRDGDTSGLSNRKSDESMNGEANVRLWHKCEVPTGPGNVCCLG